MKIKAIPTGNAPEFYTFDGETVTAVKDGVSESFDLSAVEAGGKFVGVSVDTLDLPGSKVIRDAYRDTAGELHVTICQRVGPGHWETGAEFDVIQYDPAAIHAVYNTEKPHAGQAWAVTANGQEAV